METSPTRCERPVVSEWFPRGTSAPHGEDIWPEPADCDIFSSMSLDLRFEVRLLRGPGAGTSRFEDFHGSRRILVGRSQKADLRLDHSTVSDRHAVIERRGVAWWVEDVGSSNGTLLNERPLAPGEPALLKPGDVLCVGPFLLLALDAGLEERTEEGASTQSLALGLVADLLAAGEVGPMARLVAVSCRAEPSVLPIPLGRPVVLGRDPGCHLVLADPEVSKRHAKIYVDREGCWLADLDSKNGTFVSGRRVQGLWRLEHGQEIQVGGSALLFEDPAQEVLEDLAQAARDIVQESPPKASLPMEIEDLGEPGDRSGALPPVPEKSVEPEVYDGQAGPGQQQQEAPEAEEDSEGNLVWLVGLSVGGLAILGAGVALYFLVFGQ